MTPPFGSREPCQVVLVDENPSYRAALSRVLSRDRGIQVVGEASDGEEAARLIERTRPNAVLIELSLGRNNAMAAVRAIARSHPTPILLLAALPRHPDHRAALRSLQAGMPSGLIDVVDKPQLGGTSGEAQIAALCRRLSAIAQARRSPERPPSADPTPSGGIPPTSCSLIALAASTGGLEAIQRVLQRLPGRFPPIVIAQHLDPTLGEQFSGLLRDSLRLDVVAVETTAPLQQSRVYVAARAQHLYVRAGFVATRPAQPGELAPSADQLFFSVADLCGDAALGIVLTGMGRDGARGLRALREAGSWTIAQDQSSALVSGMPAAAIELGACREVLGLDEIARRLSHLLPRGSR